MPSSWEKNDSRRTGRDTPPGMVRDVTEQLINPKSPRTTSPAPTLHIYTNYTQSKKEEEEVASIHLFPAEGMIASASKKEKKN